MSKAQPNSKARPRKTDPTPHTQPKRGRPSDPTCQLDYYGSGLKKCRTCKEIKPATKFYVATKAPDGLAVECKPCRDIATNNSRRRKAERDGNPIKPMDQILADAKEKYEAKLAQGKKKPGYAPDLTLALHYYGRDMKKCSVCEEVKHSDDFGVNRGTRDGFFYRCKTCGNKYSREYFAKKRAEKGETRSRGRPAGSTKRQPQLRHDFTGKIFKFSSIILDKD